MIKSEASSGYSNITCLWHRRPACYDAVPCRRLSGAERQLKPSISTSCEPPRCRAACPRQVNLPTCTPGGQQRLFLSDCHPFALSLFSLCLLLLSSHPLSAFCLFSSALLPQACLTSNVSVLYGNSQEIIQLIDLVTLDLLDWRTLSCLVPIINCKDLARKTNDLSRGMSPELSLLSRPDSDGQVFTDDLTGTL